MGLSHINTLQHVGHYVDSILEVLFFFLEKLSNIMPHVRTELDMVLT